MTRSVFGIVAAVTVTAAAAAVAAPAATPRDILLTAAFQPQTKASALAQIAAAQAAAEAQLKATPGDREAGIVRAMAIGYRAKLERSRADAAAAKKLFDGIAAADPRDPQGQIIIAGWHLDAVYDVGRMMAGAVLGARSADGLAALDRAVVLGANQHAAYPAIASLMRIRLDATDVARARQLAEAAVKAPAVTALDRVMQRNAAAVLVPLRAGNGKAAATMAAQLLPFARLKG